VSPKKPKPTLGLNTRPSATARVQRVAEALLPTRFGPLLIVAYQDLQTGGEPVALVSGQIAGGKQVLTYVHQACAAGDVFRSLACGCRLRLEQALKAICDVGGIVIYGGADLTSAVGDGDAGTFVQPMRCPSRASEASTMPFLPDILVDLGVRSTRPFAAT
jgi:hypothetical protein